MKFMVDGKQKRFKGQIKVKFNVNNSGLGDKWMANSWNE